jgi:pSer/pThr/pTyr-binding forkhead associated (FHA) protein
MANNGLPVRLSFPKGEHQDVIVQLGETTIGSSPDNSVVVNAEGVQPHHATIVVDNRGFTLFVRNQDTLTHVNARPVREKAILRLGDVVSLDSVNIVLKPDSDQSIRPAPSSNGAELARQTPAKAVLRAVSGPYFGKVIPVQGRLVIGRATECDLVLEEPDMKPQHAAIEVLQGEIHLRDLGSSSGTLVNGVAVRDAMLHSGDQIAFDRNRFLVEAPGMPLRKYEPVTAESSGHAPAPAGGPQPQVTQTMRAIRIEEKPADKADTPPTGTPAAPEVQPEAEDDMSLWWLIGAGALIALGIALLLFGIR